MNSVIWKFPLSPTAASVEMPRQATILHAHAQGDDICVWAEVDPSAPVGPRWLLVVPTGGRLTLTAAYVGTVHLPTGLVFHVYDGGEAA